MAKFKLSNGRIITVDDDEIRDLVLAGAGEEVDDVLSPEDKKIAADQMREQGKIQFAQDMEAQRKAEYESRFESPTGNIVKNLFPYSNPYDQNKYERVINAGKDIFSLPTRLGKEILGAGAEVQAAKLFSKDPRETESTIAESGSRFWDNVGKIDNQGIIESVVTDPLLIPSYATGTALANVGIKAAPYVGPIIRGTAQGALNTVSEAVRPGEYGVLTGIKDFAVGAVPDLIFPTIGSALKNLKTKYLATEANKELEKKVGQAYADKFADIPPGTPDDEIEAALKYAERNKPIEDIIGNEETIASLESALERSKQKLADLYPDKKSNWIAPTVGGFIGHSVLGIPGGVVGAGLGYVGPKITPLIKKGSREAGLIVGQGAYEAEKRLPKINDEYLKTTARMILQNVTDGNISRADANAKIRALESLKYNPNDSAAIRILQQK